MIEIITKISAGLYKQNIAVLPPKIVWYDGELPEGAKYSILELRECDFEVNPEDKANALLTSFYEGLGMKLRNAAWQPSKNMHIQFIMRRFYDEPLQMYMLEYNGIVMRYANNKYLGTRELTFIYLISKEENNAAHQR